MQHTIDLQKCHKYWNSNWFTLNKFFWSTSVYKFVTAIYLKNLCYYLQINNIFHFTWRLICAMPVYYRIYQLWVCRYWKKEKCCVKTTYGMLWMRNGFWSPYVIRSSYTWNTSQLTCATCTLSCHSH